MTTEIEIILENQNSFTQGNCFERLVRNILEIHRYQITQNVNFTGMEIDLLAKHKDKNNEILYVECKAKNKVTSDEITKFLFNVMHKRVNTGYFIRTKELEHQAAGLLDEISKDDRYKHITFFQPNKVIDLLIDANKIKNFNNSDIEGNITKKILVVSYFGDFLVLLTDTSLSALPTHYYIFNVATGEFTSDEETKKRLEDKIPELLNIEVVTPTSKTYYADRDINNIAEVQESENWYDYLPASSKHFIGRDHVRNEVFSFFERVTKKETKKRVFYLTAKSGWGKSSLTAEIRGKCRNKFHKNKYYALAIDSRSALSSNFVALSFQRLIDKANRDEFLPQEFSISNIKFTSSQDLLNSQSIKHLLEYLEKQNKIIILIFDQFEDVFRKEGLFKSFYKFLTDVNDIQSNIIVGFSWKTEILIPSENEAYHYWQQAKEQTISYSLQEFGSKEIIGVIKQLESSIGPINVDLKRRLIESSQGFPWLIKKLCIHIYEQIKGGSEIEDLIDENLNFGILFKSDLESLNGDEVKALKYIAKRAYDGNFFEATEVNDVVPEKIINSLRDKRLIIRSGISYNVYWDIFRDYLVTNEMPIIGESYIFRQSVNTCLEVFLLFERSLDYTLSQLHEKLGKRIKKGALENVLIELRSIGLVRKIDGRDSFSLYDNNIIPSEDFFSEYLTSKLQIYSPYLLLKNIKTERINNHDLIKILKTVFRGYTFNDKTWRTYANVLTNWIILSNLEIKNKIDEPKKGGAGRRGIKRKTITSNRYDLRFTSIKILQALELDDLLEKCKIDSKLALDLQSLDIVSYENKKYKFTDLGSKIIRKDEGYKKMLAASALKIPLIKVAYEFIINKPFKVKSLQLFEGIPHLYDHVKKPSSKALYASQLLNWANFVKDNI